MGWERSTRAAVSFPRGLGFNPTRDKPGASIMNFRQFFSVFFAFMVFLIFSLRLSAQTQTTGDIAGVVTDPTGAVVPNAKVTLKDESRGNTQDTTTNQTGAYRYYLLPPGPHTVTVTVTGFKVVNRSVEVTLGSV